MARQKRSSSSIVAAEKRASGLASIDAGLDLGNGNTLAVFQAKITATQKLLDDYNTLLGELDAHQNTLETAETVLDQMSSAMLTGVGLKFGKDSSEYENAGGTRTSDRKPPVRKARAAAPAK